MASAASQRFLEDRRALIDVAGLDARGRERRERSGLRLLFVDLAHGAPRGLDRLLRQRRRRSQQLHAEHAELRGRLDQRILELRGARRRRGAIGVGLHRHDVAHEQRPRDAIVHSQRRLQGAASSRRRAPGRARCDRARPRAARRARASPLRCNARASVWHRRCTIAADALAGVRSARASARAARARAECASTVAIAAANICLAPSASPATARVAASRPCITARCRSSSIFCSVSTAPLDVALVRARQRDASVDLRRARRDARARPSPRRDRCGPRELRRRRCRRQRAPGRTDRRCRAACRARLPARRAPRRWRRSAAGFRSSLRARGSHAAVCCAPATLPARSWTVAICTSAAPCCRFASIRFAVSRAPSEIVSRDLREHDVVQHPVAKGRLADLLDRGERLVNRAVGGGLRRSASARARCWRAFRHVDTDRRWFRRQRARARARRRAIARGSSTDCGVRRSASDAARARLTPQRAEAAETACG